jgi:hypothetical protein
VGIESIQLSALLLRQQAPELVLRLGSTVAARVIERHGSRGLISIGTAVLTAELPEQVNAGDRLRLLVHDATGDKITLKIAEEQTPQPQQAHAFASVPLPNGASARLTIQEDGGAADSGQLTEHSVALTYNSPTLGSLRFRLLLDPGAVSANVYAARGVPLDMTEAAAEELRDALAEVTGRPAQVRVAPRDDPVDLYA